MYHPQWWWLFGSHSLLKTHTQTSIWTLTLTTISNTRGLLYEHSLTVQTAWSPNRSRKMLRSELSSPHSKPMATRSGPLRSPTPKQVRHHRGPGPHQRGLLYIRGTSEKLVRIFKNHGVGAYHKPFNTLRSILVQPKDKTPDHKKCGVVYEIQCPECSAQHVGETARTLETRMKNHLK